jgi:hypothetical protein
VSSLRDFAIGTEIFSPARARIMALGKERNSAILPPFPDMSFHTKTRRLLGSLGLATLILLLEVATARTFVYFAQPNLNPGPLWLPFAVRIPLFFIMTWGTYRLLTIQAESYWHQMSTQNSVRNACQILLNAAHLQEPQSRTQIEDAVSQIQVVLSADPATKRANARIGEHGVTKVG